MPLDNVLEKRMKAVSFHKKLKDKLMENNEYIQILNGEVNTTELSEDKKLLLQYTYCLYKFIFYDKFKNFNICNMDDFSMYENGSKDFFNFKMILKKLPFKQNKQECLNALNYNANSYVNKLTNCNILFKDVPQMLYTNDLYNVINTDIMAILKGCYLNEDLSHRLQNGYINTITTKGNISYYPFECKEGPPCSLEFKSEYSKFPMFWKLTLAMINENNYKNGSVKEYIDIFKFLSNSNLNISLPHYFKNDRELSVSLLANRCDLMNFYDNGIMDRNIIMQFLNSGYKNNKFIINLKDRNEYAFAELVLMKLAQTLNMENPRVVMEKNDDIDKIHSFNAFSMILRDTDVKDFDRSMFVMDMQDKYSINFEAKELRLSDDDVLPAETKSKNKTSPKRAKKTPEGETKLGPDEGLPTEGTGDNTNEETPEGETKLGKDDGLPAEGTGDNTNEETPEGETKLGPDEGLPAEDPTQQANPNNPNLNPLGNTDNQDNMGDEFILQLDNEQSNLEKFQFRRSVAKMANFLNENEISNIEKRTVNHLNYWCKYWLWIVKPEHTQKLLSELKLKKYFKGFKDFKPKVDNTQTQPNPLTQTDPLKQPNPFEQPQPNSGGLPDDNTQTQDQQEPDAFGSPL